MPDVPDPQAPPVPEPPAAPPVTRAPAGAVERIQALPEEDRKYFEELLADRGNLRKGEAAQRERADKAERVLSQMQTDKQEQERQALEEQNRYKELYEKEQASRTELETKFVNQQKLDAVRRELMAAGALDEDIVEVILNRGAESIKFENNQVYGVKELVAGYKEAKPHMFKDATVPPPEPPRIGTGFQTPPPSSGAAPRTDMLKATKDEANDAWQDYLNTLKR